MLSFAYDNFKMKLLKIIGKLRVVLILWKTSVNVAEFFT